MLISLATAITTLILHIENQGLLGCLPSKWVRNLFLSGLLGHLFLPASQRYQESKVYKEKPSILYTSNAMSGYFEAYSVTMTRSLESVRETVFQDDAMYKGG